MVDVTGGLVTGLLAQVFGDLASDLVEGLVRPPRGAGAVDRPLRIESRRPDPLRPRAVGRTELDKLITGLAGRLTGVRRSLAADLPDHEWVAALAAVRDTLARSMPIDAELVLTRARLDPQRLEALIRANAPDLVATAGLSAAGNAVYAAMLTESCAHMVEFITSRREFTIWAGQEAVRGTGKILDRVDELAAGLTRADLGGSAGHDDEDREFSRRYAAFISSRLDTLEVVGVTLRRTPRRYALDVAYTDLSAARAGTPGGTAGPEELSGSGVPVTELLRTSPRVVLRGAAGSGKTTTVQRLAVTAARDATGATASGTPGSTADERLTVPFLIPLRRFVGRGLPAPQDLLADLARPLAHAAPAGWIDRVLLDGRALVLVDGVDEVPGRASGGRDGAPRVLRQDVETWLAELVTAYPDCRVVVTTRTSAVPEHWLVESGFDTVDLLPMGPRGIRDLIERWHDAVAPDVAAGQADQLQKHRTALPGVIASRPELHRLAATPLLCALICALNWDRQMELPTDRAGLYEAALDMLLDRRDVQRGVSAPEGLELSAREQSVLLQRLAYHLLKNEIGELGADAARAQLERVMPRTRVRDAAPTDVLRHLLARTGLLREDPHSRGIHFVHRTFQDYLAGREALEEGDIGLLVRHGYEDRWRDVVVMAAAQARPRECGALLTGLLELGDHEPARRERLHLTAAAAMAQSAVVEPAAVRDRVTRATAALIPPTSNEGAASLARAGDFVIDLLPGPEGLDDQQAAYVVRTAAMIGTEAARDLILRFIPGEPSPRIVDELLRAWRAAPEPEDYARTVLAAVRFRDATVAVHRHRLPYLRHLPHLHSVRYLGDLVDLDAFALMPALHQLELFQNETLRDRHLTVLAECPALRRLDLVRCPGVHDLSVLAGAGLTSLSLTFLDQLEIGSLAALTTLTDLSIRLRRLDDLTTLPVLPLRRLAFGGRLPQVALAGIERFVTLEHVDLIGTPMDDDLSRLASLPRLTSLVVTAEHDGDRDWAVRLRQSRPGLAVAVTDARSAGAA